MPRLQLAARGGSRGEAEPILVGRSGRRIRSDLPGKYHGVRKRLQRAQVALVATSGLVVLLCTLIGFWSFQFELREQSLRHTLHERSAALRQMNVDLEGAREEIERLKLALASGLHPLERDRAISLNGISVRSILFTALPGGVGEGYRYQLTLDGERAGTHLDDLSLLLFDHRGVEIARFSLAGRAGESSPLARALPSARGRSYSGLLRGSRLEQARFFRIE